MLPETNRIFNEIQSKNDGILRGEGVIILRLKIRKLYNI